MKKVWVVKMERTQKKKKEGDFERRTEENMKKIEEKKSEGTEK